MAETKTFPGRISDRYRELIRGASQLAITRHRALAGQWNSEIARGPTYDARRRAGAADLAWAWLDTSAGRR